MDSYIEDQQVNTEMLGQIVDRLADDYAHKKPQETNSQWLARNLEREMPELSLKDAMTEGALLVEHMEEMSSQVDAAQRAAATGISAEQWGVKYVRGLVKDLPYDEAERREQFSVIREKLEKMEDGCQKAYDSLRNCFGDDKKAGSVGAVIDEITEPEKEEPDPGEKSGAIKSTETAMMVRLRSFIKEGLVPIDVYDISKMVYQVGQHAAAIGIGGMALSIVMQSAYNLYNKRGISKEDVKKSLLAGGDAGLKVITICALKVAAVRGIVPFLTKTTPSLIIISIASIGIEGAKIMERYADKEITGLEAMDAISRTAVAVVFSLGFTSKGAMIGATVFGVIPVVGSLMGAVIGGAVGNFAGGELAKNERLMNFALSARKCCIREFQVIKESIVMVEEEFARLRKKEVVTEKNLYQI